MNSQMSTRLERLRLQLMAGENAAQIGARIREAREAKGWTRRQLAREMDGVASDNDLYRWETGRHRPHDETLATIAKALHLPLSYFLDFEHKDETPDVLGALNGDTPAVEQLVAAVSALDERLRLFQVETAARDLEVLRLLEEALPPKRRSQGQPPQ